MRALLLGLAGLLGGYILPVLLNSVQFLNGILPSTSFVLSSENIDSVVGRQPLLWERLWPNATYPSGVVPGLLLAAGPLIILLIYLGIRGTWKLNRWQCLAILGVQTAFLVVGLIASVKIGGGSNLHNLDMFLVGLVCLAALAWEAGGAEIVRYPKEHPRWIRLLVIIAVLHPATQEVFSAGLVTVKGVNQASEAMEHILYDIEQVKGKGEVLFMDQRQLLTFGYVKGVPLVPEYEKKYMMDQALAANAAYFAGFYRDLAQHRFSLIIGEVMRTYLQGEESSSGSENNAWVKWVSTPVLCYYSPLDTYEDVNVQVLVPRSEPLSDPDVCP